MEDNEIIKAMKERRSCRAFLPDEIPAELVGEVIEAGLWAASSMGKQSPVILKVTDPGLRERFRAANAVLGGWEKTFDPFYGAPVILVVLAPREWANRVYDGSLVMGNLMLAAHSLGLGSIWIHRAREEFEMPEFQELLAQAGIEGRWEGIGHCALGLVAEGGEGRSAKRRPRRVFEL